MDSETEIYIVGNNCGENHRMAAENVATMNSASKTQLDNTVRSDVSLSRRSHAMDRWPSLYGNSIDFESRFERRAAVFSAV